VSELSFEIADPGLRERLVACIDPEGKIPRAIDALGPVADRRVVLLDAGEGLRARQLTELGARVTALPGTATEGLPGGLADVVVSLWSAFRGGTRETEAQVREAERITRPGARLLVLHDYGRDDVSRLLDDLDREREQAQWSHRMGWFLVHGFKIRVIHCWWSFSSIPEARELLSGAFGAQGETVADAMTRPRLSYKIAIYHRTLGEPEDAVDAERADSAPAIE
jgi:hypothetical protein